MKIGEKLEILKRSKDYNKDRAKISDQFIEFIKMAVPNEWKKIEERETAYQVSLKK
jgi:hypothetical protein